MVQKSSNLEKFWQELKRRKVFSVITTYAATAYIIIEVTNNLALPLHLPEWVATLVLILLIIGLPVAIILSWIFDFTPKGIIKTESQEESEGKEIVTKPVKRKLKVSYVLNAVLIIAVIFLIYPKIFKRNTLERLRSSGEKVSIAVMPFQNMTNDTIWDVWQDGIQNELINNLANPEELQVRPTESVNAVIRGTGLTNYASITPTVASKISQKLDANIFVTGSIKKADTIVRINAQMVDSRTLHTFKSFQKDGTTRSILDMIDSLSLMVKNFLIISELEKENVEFKVMTSTNSPEAYKYFILGKNAYYNSSLQTSINWLNQACAIDSNFTWAMWFLSIANQDFGLKMEARKLAFKLYRKKDLMPIMEKLWVSYQYTQFFQPTEAINYLKQLEEIDNQFPLVFVGLGWTYLRLKQFDNAINEYEKYFEIYNRWGLKPQWAPYYYELALAYHKTGQFKKEKKLYKKAELSFPNDLNLIYGEAVLSLYEGDKIAASRNIDRFISVCKHNSRSEASIAGNLADIYSEGGISDKAEQYYRQALSLEPDSAERMNNLAYFLIDKERNLNEGLNLIDKTLNIYPNSYTYLKTKGWGLYKLEKYKEALEILQKSWDLRRNYGEYDHEAYIQLEAAKKAVAGQKND
jgi:tetratricopeptide (TPR) repeat protein